MARVVSVELFALMDIPVDSDWWVCYTPILAKLVGGLVEPTLLLSGIPISQSQTENNLPLKGQI